MAAAVAYADGTERDLSLTAQNMVKIWVSPSTMDSNDTVVLPTVTGATVRVLACFDNTTGDSVTATVSSYTVTLDASGGGTDQVMVLTYMYQV